MINMEQKIVIPLPVKLFFIIGFMGCAIGGLLGIIYSSSQLIKILSLSRIQHTNIAHVVSISSRGRSSEDSIYFKIVNDETKYRVNIAKLFDLDINIGDTIHIIFDKNGKYFVVVEYINKLLVTNILRILIFIVCLFISVLLFKGLKSLYGINRIKNE